MQLFSQTEWKNRRMKILYEWNCYPLWREKQCCTFHIYVLLWARAFLWPFPSLSANCYLKRVAINFKNHIRVPVYKSFVGRGVLPPGKPCVFFSFLIAIAHQSKCSSIFFFCERANIVAKVENRFLVTAKVSSTRNYASARDALSSSYKP